MLNDTSAAVILDAEVVWDVLESVSHAQLLPLVTVQVHSPLGFASIHLRGAFLVRPCPLLLLALAAPVDVAVLLEAKAKEWEFHGADGVARS